MFKPALGLSDPHAQTIFASLFRPSLPPGVARERIETPDGDFVDVDHLEAAKDAPRLLVLHGLEGSSKSGYVGTMFRGAAARGWNVSVLNFRSCSGEENRLARSYHSGDTGDVLFVAKLFRERSPAPLVAAGFSLGANVLLRSIIETGTAAPFVAAAAMSAPFDLEVCARALDAGRSTLLYRKVFLRTLKQKALAKARRHPGVIDVKRVHAADGIEAFDDAVTAPLNGFTGSADYYAKSSSRPGVDRIRIPTLLLSAKDDPLIPAASLPDPSRLPANVQARFLPHGGHVGFVAGGPIRPVFWGDLQLLEYLAGQLARR